MLCDELVTMRRRCGHLRAVIEEDKRQMRDLELQVRHLKRKARDAERLARNADQQVRDAERRAALLKEVNAKMLQAAKQDRALNAERQKQGDARPDRNRADTTHADRRRFQ